MDYAISGIQASTVYLSALLLRFVAWDSRNLLHAREVKGSVVGPVSLWSSLLRPLVDRFPLCLAVEAQVGNVEASRALRLQLNPHSLHQLRQLSRPCL